jgi:hypothetical protein
MGLDMVDVETRISKPIKVVLKRGRGQGAGGSCL